MNIRYFFLANVTGPFGFIEDVPCVIDGPPGLNLREIGERMAAAEDWDSVEYVRVMRREVLNTPAYVS